MKIVELNSLAREELIPRPSQSRIKMEATKSRNRLIDTKPASAQKFPIDNLGMIADAAKNRVSPAVCLKHEPTSGRHCQMWLSPNRPSVLFAGLLCLSTVGLLTSQLARPASANHVFFPSTEPASNANSPNSSWRPISGLEQQPIVTGSFSTPNQDINITHVTYDPVYDTIYVGATNAIYQLNGSDLSEQFAQSTGPVLDNPSCGITECHGYEDYMKLTPNVNKILVIDYQHQKLLSCGSTKQGACRRYKLNNIAQKEDLISMAVAANDDNSSTYAFIAPARYTYDPSSVSTNVASGTITSPPAQQQVLYVGATYTKLGQSRDLLVPAIGTRILDDGPNLLKLYENSFVDSARIDINSHLRDYFLVNYLYGFSSSNYIYFITVQKKATSRDYEELGYHTRLARVCISDSSYNSYTEVDLKCLPNKKRSASSIKQHQMFFGNSQQSQTPLPSEYPLLQDAILVDAGSQLLQSLAQNDQSSPLPNEYLFSNGASASPDDNKVLLGVFSSAKDHTQHPGEHSALCAFSLAQIEDKFNDNIHSCYTGKMQSRNMEYIAGNVQECPKSGQGGNVVNFCHETLKINGTIPIVSEASIQFYNTTLSAITATSHVNSNLKNIYASQISNHLSAFNSSASKAFTSKQPILPQPNLMQQAQNQHTVAFVGTSNGHIKKILLNNASNAIEFEDVQADASNQPILSDLHLHSSGQQLIAATPYKVIKMATHNCGQYATCRECSQSRNPYCGWCSLRRSCSTRNECMGAPNGEPSGHPTSPANRLVAQLSQSQQANQLKWISNDSPEKCIDLQSIVPDKIPITSTGKIDLYIDRLPRLPKEHSYRCTFDRKEQTLATPTTFGLACPLPKVMLRPKIQPGRDHAIVDLAVRSTETNTDFLNGKITFFECQLHTTCKDCLTTNWGCNWCINENVCLFNTSKCDKSGPLPAQSLANRSSAELHQLGPSGSARPTTSAPVITIGNGSSQRSSLSLTTISSSLGASFSTSLVQSAFQSSGNTINQVSQCPTFDVGYKQDILIADGSEKELIIKVKNMPQIKGNVKCNIEIENDKIQLRARIEDDRVICDRTNYSYSADVGLLNGQLMVVYSDNNIFIDRTNLTLYKCRLLGAHLSRPDCSLCRSSDARFGCAWCSGSCEHRSACSARPDDTCPPPRIDSVQPLSGPTYGGTRVTIEGSNLGQSFDEISGRVSIGNVPCRPVEDEYRTSNRIVCVTSPLPSNRLAALAGSSRRESDASIPSDVLVGNRAGYSSAPAKFHYKPIFLRDHQPRYGPQSGGTRLTLSGLNLNVGSSVQVFLDELACLVEQSLVTSEQIVCKTSASKQPNRPIRQLRLVIDDAQITRDEDVFYYTQDPTITRIAPLRSYLSGGRPLTVYGANLTSVQAPRMLLLDPTTGRKINESACQLQDDSRMQCPSPGVNLALMDLDWSQLEQHLGHYEAPSTWTPVGAQPTGPQPALPQQDSLLKFRLGFVMDDVWRRRDLLTSAGNGLILNTDIAYTSDPRVYPFSSAEYGGDELAGAQQPRAHQHSSLFQLDSDTYLLQPGEPVLQLRGEHLRTAVSDYEITVTVGTDLCNTTHITQTRLVCALALDRMATPTDEDGHQTQRELPLVVVRIGFNLRYEVGYVQYHPLLVDQIFQTIANSSPNAQQQLAFMRSAGSYPNYTPRETDNFLQRVGQHALSALVLALYLALGSALALFVYSALAAGYKVHRRAGSLDEYRRVRAKLESIEKSVRDECRAGSLALQAELDELLARVHASGCPLFPLKQYMMNVFYPGIDKHPVASPASQDAAWLGAAGALNRLDASAHLQPLMQPLESAIERPLAPLAESPGQHFERLLMNKSFLVIFVNVLERQASFTIRDKINVASLLMVSLMGKPEYATDVMRSLLLQLVERSVSRNRNRKRLMCERAENSYAVGASSAPLRPRPARRALGLKQRTLRALRQLPASAARKRPAKLSKVLSGSANSLMASTQVAARMLLARVGAKSPLGLFMEHEQQATSALGDPRPASPSAKLAHCISTTAFNRRGSTARTLDTRRAAGGRHFEGSTSISQLDLSRASAHSASPFGSGSGSAIGSAIGSGSAHSTRHNYNSSRLMLRRTESVVEKMLTNWLALNMYDQFAGPVGRSLYLMFEALRLQLERGPIDALSGDAYYSLSESRLLREPRIRFEPIKLYVLVDAQLVQHAQIYQDPAMLVHARGHELRAPLAKGATLSVRVLDCDSIGQVKAKALSALYRNSPSSARLALGEVALWLRPQLASDVGSLELRDDDCSSLSAPDGSKRLNTLRHYGVVEQAVVLLARRRAHQADARRSIGDILDEHYNSNSNSNNNNPYSEIQYAPLDSQQSSGHAAGFFHLTRCGHNEPATTQRNAIYLHQAAHESNDSSPASNSPSMLLLANDNTLAARSARPFGQQRDYPRQQPYYQPSSSSNSSLGNGTLDPINPISVSASIDAANNLLGLRTGDHAQPIYCQIGSASASASAPSQHDTNASGYYCQIKPANVQPMISCQPDVSVRARLQREQEQSIYLARMLASKGTVHSYVDHFLRTILNAKDGASGAPDDANKFGPALCGQTSGQLACPPAVKWLFDLLDEAALQNGVTDPSVIHSWKSNAFLFRFWVNMIKNPQYVLDSHKSNTLDASLSVVAQTLMDACSPSDSNPDKDANISKLIFSKDVPKYRNLVKRFYQDIASSRPVSDQEVVRHMSSQVAASGLAGQFNTQLALKELCVYAVNYGVELMEAINNDYSCQQLNLSQMLEQCFRSFTLFEAYR